jgi:hypothetical protein
MKKSLDIQKQQFWKPKENQIQLLINAKGDKSNIEQLNSISIIT